MTNTICHVTNTICHVTNTICHVTISGSSKSQLERAEEEAMMEELTQLVMRRDQLMWQLDEDKTRWVWLM